MSVLIVFILVLINLFIHFIQVIKLRNFDDQFINYINCDLYIANNKQASFISINEVIADENESNPLKRYNTFCYCKYNIVNFGKKLAENVYYEKEISSISGVEQTVRVFPCRKWLRILDNTIKYDIIRYILLVLFNCFSLRIIQILPYYERYKTIMEERKRLMILVYFYGIFANGINTILTNMNISIIFLKYYFFSPY